MYAHLHTTLMMMTMRTNSYSLSFSLLLLWSSFCLHQGTAAAAAVQLFQQTSSANQSLRAAAAAASAVDGNDNGDGDNGNEESRKIVGGEKVKWGEAPWQVAIFERDDAHDKFCGGALIGPRTVLTAAHCIDKGQVLALFCFVFEMRGRQSFLNLAHFLPERRTTRTTLWSATGRWTSPRAATCLWAG